MINNALFPIYFLFDYHSLDKWRKTRHRENELPDISLSLFCVIKWRDWPWHSLPPTRVYPSWHSQWYEPMLLMQRPLRQLDGLSHSLISLRDDNKTVKCKARDGETESLTLPLLVSTLICKCWLKLQPLPSVWRIYTVGKLIYVCVYFLFTCTTWLYLTHLYGYRTIQTHTQHLHWQLTEQNLGMQSSETCGLHSFQQVLLSPHTLFRVELPPTGVFNSGLHQVLVCLFSVYTSAPKVRKVL